jgi:hypothetical protein
MLQLHNYKTTVQNTLLSLSMLIIAECALVAPLTLDVRSCFGAQLATITNEFLRLDIRTSYDSLVDRSAKE